MSNSNSASVISRLSKLNLIDAEYYQKLAEKQKIEEKLNSQSAQVVQVADNLKVFKTTLKAKLLSYKNQESFFKDEQLKLVDRRKSLATLNDYKLQEKASKEIDQAARQLSAQEEQLISQLDALEQEKSSVEEREKQLTDEEAKLEEVSQEVAGRGKELADNLAKLSAEREEILKNVHPKDINHYKRLASKYPGKVVVATDGNSCGGCYYTLGAQQLVQLSREQEVVSCPSCGRILYMDKTPKESEEPTEKA